MSPPLNPPSFTTSPELRKQDLILDAFGQVGPESTKVGVDSAVDDDYDNNKECCGKTVATIRRWKRSCATETPPAQVRSLALTSPTAFEFDVVRSARRFAHIASGHRQVQSN